MYDFANSGYTTVVLTAVFNAYCVGVVAAARDMETAMLLAAVIGPLTYGLATYVSPGNHRLALPATTAFFTVGLAPLLTVDEWRGRAAAQSAP